MVLAALTPEDDHLKDVDHRYEHRYSEGEDQDPPAATERGQQVGLEQRGCACEYAEIQNDHRSDEER